MCNIELLKQKQAAHEKQIYGVNVMTTENLDVSTWPSTGVKSLSL